MPVYSIVYIFPLQQYAKGIAVVMEDALVQIYATAQKDGVGQIVVKVSYLWDYK